MLAEITDPNDLGNLANGPRTFRTRVLAFFEILNASGETKASTSRRVYENGKKFY
jgi:hypothetical protein